MLALTDRTALRLDQFIDKDDPSVEKVKSAGGPIVKTFDGNLKNAIRSTSNETNAYRQVHEFKMQAGKTYTIDLVSDDFDAYLRIEARRQRQAGGGRRRRRQHQLAHRLHADVDGTIAWS